MTSATEALGPGLHYNIPFLDYLAIPALDNTKLKEWENTPADAREAELHPEASTEAQVIGSATHAAVFEPKRFERQYAKTPKWDLRTTRGKTAKAEWDEAHPDFIRLSRDEYDMACGMRDSVWANKQSVAFLTAPGNNEVTAIWHDEKTGLLCKGRFDRIIELGGYTFIVDLKTCKKREASVKNFPTVIGKFQYFQQAAFYMDGLNVLAPHPRRFVFMAVEKTRPYLVAHHELDDSDIKEGRARYRWEFDELVKARETSDYHGYPEGIEGITMPKYFYEFTTPPR